MSICNSRLNSASIADYYAQDDYHAEGGKTQGQWYGWLAAALGYSGACDAPTLQKLLVNDPKALPNRPKLLNSCGFDLTMCADKSFSIAALVLGEELILQMHRQAVESAIELAEQFVCAKDGKINNISQRQVTGNFMAATFEHNISRCGDPHLHTHVIIPNVTRRKDGELRAIDASLLYQKQTLILAQYHSEMAKLAQRCGLEVQNHSSAYFVARITHVPPSLIKEFSRSTQKIEAALDGADKNSVSPGRRAMLARKVRDKKQTISRDDALKGWRQRVGFLSRMKLSLTTAQDKPFAMRVRALLADENAMREKKQEWLASALEHLSERNAAFKEDDLIIALTRFSQGLLSPREGQQFVNELVQNKRLKRGDRRKDYLTTPELIAETQNILALCRQREGYDIDRYCNCPAFIMDATARHKLEQDQQRILSTTTTNGSQVMALSGCAGTGKTTTLAAINEVATQAGWRVRGIAPTKKSVAGLQEAGLEKTQTVAAWLAKKFKGLGNKTLLIVDESSLVSSKAMLKILQHAVASNSKVLLVGDPGQYQAVERGRPFDAILNHTEVPQMVLDIVRRQQTDEMRDMAKKAQTNTAEAIKVIYVVERTDPQEQYEAVAKHYLTDPDKAIILTGTHEARKRINEAVRERMGLKGKGTNIISLRKKNLTQAELTLTESYQRNDFVVLSKDYKRLGAGKNHPLLITDRRRNAQGHIELECTDAYTGSKHRLNLATMSKRFISVYKYEVMELSVGDKLYQENLETREAKFVRITAATPDGMQCMDEDGNQHEINKGQLHFAMYAYAMTGMKFQGATVERVIVHKPALDTTTHQRSMYTDLTRASKEAIVVTDDISALQKALQHKPCKICITDIVEKTPEPENSNEEELRQMLLQQQSLEQQHSEQQRIEQQHSDQQAPVREREEMER